MYTKATILVSLKLVSIKYHCKLKSSNVNEYLQHNLLIA